MDSLIELGRNTFMRELEALQNVSDLLDDHFDKSIEVILQTTGHVVVTGMGKSGYIGMKIASTFSSTGTPSFFLHPAEAAHGDLGMLRADDLLIAISYSGESEELFSVFAHAKNLGIKIITFTGKRESSLALMSDCILDISVHVEASALPMVPMASMTAALVMGDAFAAALIQQRGFTEKDFALLHPGGSLGRKMLAQVESIMVTEPFPIVSSGTLFQEIIDTTTDGGMGLCIVMENREILGVITDGDIRRSLHDAEHTRFDLRAAQIMNPSPKKVSPDTSLAEAEKIMLQHHIKELLVVEKEQLRGVIQMYAIEQFR